MRAKLTALTLKPFLSLRVAAPNARYIWETRIRDNSHLGVVDVSCQPAKAKVGKRKPSLLAAQKEENAAQRLAAQQQQHFQRQQQQQAYMQVCVCLLQLVQIASAVGAETDVCVLCEAAAKLVRLLCGIGRRQELSGQAAVFATNKSCTCR